ncbi:MAG: PIN domain-containing protein [Pyrinomonadaceae bacterium]|nr:PIN domain-containing protein [Pyrinomonadaceae bacterium]
MDARFADAFYWIALSNPADQWHDALKKFDEDNPDVLLVTTEEVLTEFLNFYAEAGKHRRRIVGVMCEQVLLHPNITVVSQSHESFSQGFELYRQREDKGYSLTDCISMAICRERNIGEILTNDHHFEQEGFIILF